MNERNNQARLLHKGQEFTIYQDRRGSWHFTYLHLVEVDTQHKELQPALNEVYATIEDLMPRKKSETGTRRKSGQGGRGKFPPQRKLHVSQN